MEGWGGAVAGRLCCEVPVQQRRGAGTCRKLDDGHTETPSGRRGRFRVEFEPQPAVAGAGNRAVRSG